MWTTGICFVWCNRKDELRAKNWWGCYMVKLFAPNYSGCLTTCIDSISSPILGRELYRLKERCQGEYRENEWVKVFYPSEDGQIDLSLIEKL